MMDIAKTGIILGIAVVVCIGAYVTAPEVPELEYFSDQGEVFYPEFTDPFEAASLEVIEFDEETGTAKPFKVQFKDGVWSIPSHHDYPADAEDRLANLAAAVIELRKDAVQSDRQQDHQELGVVDPLDETIPTFEGRGKRVTLRDESGSVLADFIFGDKVEDKQGFRYVRLPRKDRTYKVKVDVNISTRFTDWIDTNLLDVSSGDIKELVVDDYSIDEATGTVEDRDRIVLRKGTGNKWTMQGLPEGKQLDESKINKMTSALTKIRITGVRPKPAGLTEDLSRNEAIQMSLGTQMSLNSKGFFLSPRDGKLYSNEGEVLTGTKAGVLYVLRFGEVIFGEGMEITAGVEEEGEDGQEQDAGGQENRYLFVTANFDESLIGPKPVAPEKPAELEAAEAEAEGGEETAEAENAEDAAEDEQDAELEQIREQYERQLERYNQALERWQQKAEEGRAQAAKLNERFAPWYYVISGSDFQDIRVNREKLVKPEKEAEEVE